jgi:protein-S-isoprenylcysteine O-methyltransferase Ste14
MRTTWLPPPAVTLLCAWAMWGVAGAPAWPGLLIGPQNWGWSQRAGVLVWCVALSLMLLALSAMLAMRTTPNPIAPEQATVLVQTGLFSVSRNPIYAADAMVLMGWAAWLANGLALLVLPVFVGYITIMQIRAEEQALSTVFGDDYQAYCRRVRRWV